MEMKRVPPANYTTQVPVTRTVSEVQEMLARRGARHVSVEFRQGSPCGLSFEIETSQGSKTFRLPVNVPGMFVTLAECAEAGVLGTRAETARRTTEAHAQRVAWRVIRDWVRAQLTLVDAGLVHVETVFLPYMLNDQGWSVAEVFEQRDLATELQLES